MPEFPPMQDVKQRIIKAIVDLYRDDHDLFHVDANERSISHKLAVHLQKRFPYWHVDCEYNRRGQETKRLVLSFTNLAATDTEAKTVYPDIIVHRRGTRENLLVIEIKKQNGQEETRDLVKLKAFKTDPNFAYQYGVFLRLDCKRCDKACFYPEAEESDFTQDVNELLSRLLGS
jgi:hypothetical protein